MRLAAAPVDRKEAVITEPMKQPAPLPFLYYESIFVINQTHKLNFNYTPYHASNSYLQFPYLHCLIVFSPG
jgi:hypothetical protein